MEWIEKKYCCTLCSSSLPFLGAGIWNIWDALAWPDSLGPALTPWLHPPCRSLGSIWLGPAPPQGLGSALLSHGGCRWRESCPNLPKALSCQGWLSKAHRSQNPRLVRVGKGKLFLFQISTRSRDTSMTSSCHPRPSIPAWMVSRPPVTPTFLEAWL